MAGRKLLNGTSRIISVCIADVGDIKEYAKNAAQLSDAALCYIGADMTVDADEFYFDTDFFGEGYEIPSAKGTAAIKRLACAEGILVDPVYSGKAFSGMLEYIASGKVPQGSSVVFWHTGGTTALFAEKAIVGDM